MTPPTARHRDRHRCWPGALAAAWLGLALPLQALAGDENALYEDRPATGTSIRQKLVLGGQLPVHKTYAELNAEQQAFLRSHYHQMPAADEPPYPRHGLVSIYKPLARLQGHYLETGEVEMYVTVGPTGQPRSVAVYKTPNPELSSQIANVLMLTEFKPAVCGGQACTMEFPLLMTLTVSR